MVTGDLPFPPSIAEKLRLEGLDVDLAPGVLSKGELARHLEGAWGYLLGGLEYADATLLEKCPELQAICFIGSGYSEFIDPLCVPPEVALAYTPGANAIAVAELMFGLTISLRRQLVSMNNRVKNGSAPPQGAFTPTLVGSTIGIIGMGHVGEAFARMSMGAYDAKIMFWNRTPKPHLTSEFGWTQCAIEDVLRQCDVVAVSCAYHAIDTHHLLNLERLELMQSHALLVSIARSLLIDPTALLAVLRDKKICGAALDGYYLEPLPDPAHDPYNLLAFPGDVLIITPHIGSFSLDAVVKMFDMAADNMIAAARGTQVPNPIPR